MRSWIWLLLVVGFGLAHTGTARAHVGNKDVFEEVTAGSYKLYVTIRPPDVVPGVAVIEVRVLGAAVSGIEITPTPLTGEAAKHPPAADAMVRSAADPAFYTGTLWLMAPGSWQVRFKLEGAGGEARTSVPVPAVALSILPMERPLGMLLAVLGVVLVLGMAGIVAAAVRESRLVPGTVATPERRRRAVMASGVAFVVVVGMVYLGDRWWKVEAATYSGQVYRALSLTPSLKGDALELKIGSMAADRRHSGRERVNTDLLLDHGQVMHLYAIRWPEMDAVFHLHPALAGPGELTMALPAMPAGEYRLYGDIVHANGFPETLTAELAVPAGMPGGALATEDASAMPQGVSKGELGTSYTLPDGYTMVWDRPEGLAANTAYTLRFRLLDGAGKPAADMQPYLGMAGHAAFVKTDGTAFAHTHPEGSAAMPAMMLAEDSSSGSGSGPSADSGAMAAMPGMDMGASAASSSEKIEPVVEFPYGFPAAGRYRVFVQMKHGGVVETGVFDVAVK